MLHGIAIRKIIVYCNPVRIILSQCITRGLYIDATLWLIHGLFYCTLWFRGVGYTPKKYGMYLFLINLIASKLTQIT